ncbi:6-phosphogluconolactonase [Bremerella volcania]|uniref:6-phosphogluconolactonase n=1 Tax=Bremerella volcania TaxID=2527984 RepID=A0A518CG46_9BACT|nr:lactonase family protein [Bremerella volcania]QDU78206.1 6-phosphogluconolactonase [Bremerella volcania]
MLTRRIVFTALTFACVAMATQLVQAQQKSKVIEIGKVVNEGLRLEFYIGTYTRGDSKGIYRSVLDPQTGQMSLPTLAYEIDNPSFLAISNDRKNLYAVGEVANFGDGSSGAVSAFTFNEDGTLELLNQEASGGGGPCHVEISPGKGFLMVSNYGGGSFATLPIGEDGQLAPATSFFQHEGSSVNEARQKGPHGHGMYHVPGSPLMLAADLGLDKVMIYRMISGLTGELTLNDPACLEITPGSGPRHLAVSAPGQRVYVLNELNSTLDVFAFNPNTGESEHLQRAATLPKDFEGNNTTAEIYIHPNGRWLYASNRGHDSIAAYRIDADTGLVTLLGHYSTMGKTPRHFRIAPDGKFLLAANQDTNNIVIFEIDQKIGTLKPLPSQISVPNPCCIEFLQK